MTRGGLGCRDAETMTRRHTRARGRAVVADAETRRRRVGKSVHFRKRPGASRASVDAREDRSRRRRPSISFASTSWPRAGAPPRACTRERAKTRARLSCGRVRGAREGRATRGGRVEGRSVAGERRRRRVGRGRRRGVDGARASERERATGGVDVGVDGDGASERGGKGCLLYTSPSPRDRTRSRMPSSA